MSSPKLASTLFTSGPLQKLLTVDPYKTADSAVKTNVSILESTKGLGEDLLKTVRTTPASVKDLARVITVTDGKVGVDKDSLLKRIMALGSGTKGPFANMSAAVQSKVFGGLEALGVTPDTSLKIKAVVGDAVGVISRANITDTRSLMDMLGAITGNKNVASLLDEEAEFALYGSLINEAIRLGIPDALDILHDKFTSDKSQRRVAELTLMQAITYGDYATVRKIIGRIGAPAARAQIPGIVGLVLTFYRFPDGTTPAQYDAQLQELVALLNLINPEWATYNRNGAIIVDLSAFTYASDDALVLLKRDAQYQLPVMIAPSYPKQNLLSIAQGNFEFLLLSGVSR